MRFIDGEFSLDVNVSYLENTVWLTQDEISYLFDTTRNNVSIHIKNIYTENELEVNSTCKDSLLVQKEGNRLIRRNIKLYNLDLILSVGYRIKSNRGNKFRIWASSVLKKYLTRCIK